MGVLRVASANLLHGMSLADGSATEAALRTTAGLLDADVVALQEIDRGQLRSGGIDQAQTVAEEIGLPWWRFVPSVYGTPGEDHAWRAADEAGTSGSDMPGPPAGPAYGIGFATRLPVVRWAVRRFPASRMSLPLLVPEQGRPRFMLVPDEPRVALAVVVEGPAGLLTMLATHLSFVPGANVAQLRALTRWAVSFPGPRLLLGDLNLPAGVAARVTGWSRLARVATYPSYAPRLQFDHALGSGIGTSAVRAVAAPLLPVSDHRALRVDLELGG